MRRSVAALACALLAIAGACDDEEGVEETPTETEEEVPTPTPATHADLAGTWRAVLRSPGGELPFGLAIGAEGETPPAVAINGEERAPLSGVEIEGRRVVLRIEGYDAEITAELDAEGAVLTGEWRKTTSSGHSRLPFVATRGDSPRFGPPGDDVGRPEGEAAGAVTSVDGSWAVRFVDDDAPFTARGELAQDGETVTGTFLTGTGDYRYLEGSYAAGLLRLSCFDGAHAFLFHGRARADGSLEGDFWSRDVYHATWTAEQLEDPTTRVLPDPFAEVRVTSEDGRLRASFDDVDGTTVSLSDERFTGKVVVVDVFGTWCPNCNDQAPLLAEWHRRYGDRGLAIVGLAFEFTDDVERSRRMIRSYAARHGLGFPLLLAGTSNKQRAAEALPDLSDLKSYPTTIFIGRDGRVRRVHSGFAGPATGEHHTELVAAFEAEIERLLEEAP